MLVGFESQSLAWLRESSRRKAELVWNSTTICWQSCSSSRGKIPQQLLGSFLSSPALTFPGSCQNSLLELMVLLHISHFTAAGAEQQELQKLQSLKRAADSLGVLLGMIILMGISPDPKFCAHTMKGSIEALQVHQFGWQKNQSSKSNHSTSPEVETFCCSQCTQLLIFRYQLKKKKSIFLSIKIMDLWVGKGGSRKGQPKQPSQIYLLPINNHPLLSLSFQRRRTQQCCFKSKLKSQFVKFSLNKRFGWVVT